MKIVINNNGERIHATLEVVDGVMIVSPKEEKVDISQFKDGDVVVYHYGDDASTIAILQGEVDTISKYLFIEDYVSLDSVEGLLLDSNYTDAATDVRFATEEEKEKLFKAIKDNGYKWNADTKTLEKLIQPKFKVGDRIKTIYKNFQYDIKELTDTHYTLVEVKDKFEYTEPIIEDKNWELVSNKFDITTLKPFESRVLVRDRNNDEWRGQFFSHYNNCSDRPYICIGNEGLSEYKQCIPYKCNEHLLGTTDDCDEYYKTWE